ncbi:MAG TPA: site-specific integrase, partial [archaeon]|nr:site-specific integrase [archaeon]
RLKRLPENNERVRWLTEEEEIELFKVLPVRYWPLIITAIETGLRKNQELIALLKEDVDLVGMSITVKARKGGRLQRIPINDRVAEALRPIMDSQHYNPKDLLFRSPAGDALTNLRNAWEAAVKAAKLHDFRFHDLRHTFASRLVMDGVPIERVQELMGHRDIRMTQRYAHLAPGHLREAVQRLVKKPGEVKPWSARYMK